MTLQPDDRVAYTREDGVVCYGTVVHIAPDAFSPEAGVDWDSGRGSCIPTEYLRKLSPLEQLADSAG